MSPPSLLTPAQQRRLARLLALATRTAAAQRAAAQARAARLAVLAAPLFPPPLALPAPPPADEELAATPAQAQPGARQWEAGRAGYQAWAGARLLDRAAAQGTVGTGDVGVLGEVRAAVDAFGAAEGEIDA